MSVCGNGKRNVCIIVDGAIESPQATTAQTLPDPAMHITHQKTISQLVFNLFCYTKRAKKNQNNFNDIITFQI